MSQHIASLSISGISFNGDIYEFVITYIMAGSNNIEIHYQSHDKIRLEKQRESMSLVFEKMVNHVNIDNIQIYVDELIKPALTPETVLSYIKTI